MRNPFPEVRTYGDEARQCVEDLQGGTDWTEMQTTICKLHGIEQRTIALAQVEASRRVCLAIDGFNQQSTRLSVWMICLGVAVLIATGVQIWLSL